VADGIAFKLVTPARVVFDGDATLVIAVTTEGEEGILPKHAPFLAALKPGILRANVLRQPSTEFIPSVATKLELGDRARASCRRCPIA
jgi:F0F1-type ATP synthase epsilon subunit